MAIRPARFPDAAVREAFRESQDRIKSMALVHEKLTQTDETRIVLKLDLDRTS